MATQCISGGRVIDPKAGIDSISDVRIRDGVIVEVRPHQDAASSESDGDQVIDAGGMIVTPGFIDMHVHLRDPGYEYKETIGTGTQAAAAGGITTVACMANTNPVNDHGAITRSIVQKALNEGCVRVKPIGAVSKGLKGETLSEIGELKAEGVVALSDDGRPVMNALLMRRAMEYANTFGLVVIEHCEQDDLAAKGVMNEGAVSMELGLRGMPSSAEEILVGRDIILSEYTGAPIHIAHVSTAGSVRLIREAKERGVPVTAEVTPHHLMLTEEIVRRWDTSTKVNPPLRTQRDVEALQEALADGTIDAVVSDHAPHASLDKDMEYDLASFGISGLETMVGLTLMLVHKGVLTYEQWVRVHSVNPAGILNIEGGSLTPGSPADVTVIDPELAWKVDSQSFRSKGKNTPFNGWALKGRPVMTIVGGEIVYRKDAR